MERKVEAENITAMSRKHASRPTFAVSANAYTHSMSVGKIRIVDKKSFYAVDTWKVGPDKPIRKHQSTVEA